MIAWRDGVALAALVLVPAMALFFRWAYRERDRALARFVEAALHPAVVLDADPRARRRRAVLLATVAALVVVSLAGPMWGFHWEEVKREGVDLIVAIDTSKSMLASDVQPNRLARAKLAVEDLLVELQGDRIGLVAFAGTAFLQCPLTLDRTAFRESLDAVEVGLIPRGGTNLQAALDTSLGAFEGRQGNHQALVLITDGESHEGNLEEVTKQASERGIKVYTVGIGTPAGEIIPTEGGYLKDRKGQVVKSRLDEDTLKRLALDTGGVYLHAAGTDLGLTQLYRDHIATMEKRDVASTLERRWEHRFQIPLAVALLLLVGESLAGAWRRRPPTALLLAVLWLGTTGASWLDPHATAREASRLYEAGRFDEAATKYREALIDDPDSALLHLNLGAAAYREGKFDDAIAALGGVPTSDQTPALTARAAYDAGNAKYRLGAAAEAEKPQDALRLYAEALAAYRRAMGADPSDEDPKFNHEFVAKKLDDLQKKLEEQKDQDQQQQDKQQQQDQQQGEQKQDHDQQQQQDQQQQDQQQQDQQGQQDPPPQDQAKDQEQQQPEGRQGEPPDQPPAEAPTEEARQPAPDEPEAEGQPDPANGSPQGDRPNEPGDTPPGGEAIAGGEVDDEARRDAEAVLDAQRDQEVRPEEMIRRSQNARVAEPMEDW